MFICDKCGECCRHLERSDVYSDLNRGDGVCIYLTGDLCSIYEQRPLLCRVDECYEAFFGGRYTREEYEKLNYDSCNLLKKEKGGK
jgi:hypothetical protein